MGIYSHDRLIALAITELKKHGAVQIRADHISGFVQPTNVGGFIPDVTATVGSVRVIVEAETTEGLAQAHTKDQLQAFYRNLLPSGGHVIIVVNKVDEIQARRLIDTITRQSTVFLIWSF